MTGPEIKAVLEQIRAVIAIPALRVGQENVRLSCPFAGWSHAHKSKVDKNPGCSIKVSGDGRSAFLCWTCGERGTLTQMVYRLAWLAKSTVLRVLGSRVADHENETWLAAPAAGVQDRRGEHLLPMVDDRALASLQTTIPKYALQRGLSLETCRAWGLGHDRERSRLVIPVRDCYGRLVGALGRTYKVGARPKYYARYFDVPLPRHLVLFGEHMLDTDVRTLTLVEGPVDAILLWQWGVRNVVALMGLGLSVDHVRRIRAWSERVVLLFDNDAAGRHAGREVERRLRNRVELYRAEYPDGAGKDPGECGSRATLEILGTPTYVV